MVPIRIAFDSPALPALAMSTLFEPVVRFWPAPKPRPRLRAAGRCFRAAHPFRGRGSGCRSCWTRGRRAPRRVVAAGGVGEEREGAGRDVVVPVDVKDQGRRRRRRRCRGRSCCLYRAAPPLAMLADPVVLRRERLVPVATLALPVVFVESACVAGGDVVAAGGVLAGGRRRRSRRCRRRCCSQRAPGADRDVVSPVVLPRARGADGDVVVAGRVRVERLVAGRDVLAAGGVGAAPIADRDVVVAAGEVGHHRAADADVACAGEASR